jgi:predicted Zn-dependent peptidase
VKRFLTALVVLAAVLALTLIPAAAGDLAAQIQSYQLDNGLRVVLRQSGEQDIVTVAIAFKCGQDLEVKPEDYGLNFWTAFIMMMGTNRRPSMNAVLRPVEETGGAVSFASMASTTLFYSKVTSHNFFTALDTVSDVVRNPMIHEVYVGALQTLGDYVDSINTDDRGIAFTKLKEGIFGEHPYAHNAEGTGKAISTNGWSKYRKHHQIYFIPNNAVLFISGSFETEAAKTYVAQCFDSWKSGPEPPQPWESKAASGAVDFIKRGTGKQAHIYLGYRVPGISHQDGPALAVLSSIWGQGGLGSRMFQELRSKQGLAYECFSSYEWLDYTDPSMLYAYIGTAPEKVTTAQEGMRAQAEQFRNEPVSGDELARGQATVINSLYRIMQENTSQVIYMAFFESAGLGYDGFEKFADAVRAVKIEDVQRVAQKYFTDPVMTTVTPELP